MPRLKSIRINARIQEVDFAQQTEQVVHVTNNLLNRVLNEVFEKQVPASLKYYVRENIEEANAQSESQHTLTGKLENSVRVAWDATSHTAILSVGDENTPYAAVRNRPIGYFTNISPKKAPFLSFFIPSVGWIRTKRTIRTPGSAFFDRAVEKVEAEIPDMIQRLAARLNTTDFDQSLFQVGGLGTQYYIGGSTSLQSYESKGLVNSSGKLTPKGRVQMRLHGRLLE